MLTYHGYLDNAVTGIGLDMDKLNSIVVDFCRLKF